MVINIIFNYCCTRVLYAKILKKSKTDETVRFFSHFCHWWQLDLREAGHLGSPGSAYAPSFAVAQSKTLLVQLLNLTIFC